MSKILTLIIFCALLLNGCTIEKKRYSSGYHTTWNVQKFIPKKTTATNFKSEKYRLLNIPKSEEDKNNPNDKTSSDSIQKNKTTLLNFEKANSKIKKQHSSISNSDTVPETKNPSLTKVKSAEKYNQEEKDFKRVKNSWLGFVFSLLTFIFSIPIIMEADAIAAYVMLVLGMVGMAVSIILIISYTIIKNKHLNQSHLYYNENYKTAPQANPNVPKNPEMIAARLAELNKKIKKHNTIRLIFLLPMVLTFTPLFLIGITSVFLFIVHSSKRRRLISERNELMYREAENNPKPSAVIQDKSSLQKKINKILSIIKINKTVLILSGLTTLILFAEASTAAINAIPLFIVIMLICILIQIILSIKKANITDELNMIQ